MRNRSCAVVIMVLTAGLALGAEEVPRGMLKHVSLDLKGADACVALKELSDKGGFDVMISKAVSGRCTLRLDDVAIKEAFDLILAGNNLACARIGNVYHVMTNREYKDRYGRTYRDARQTKVFRLQHAVPATAFKLVCTMMNEEYGKVVVDEESGTLLIMDAPETIKEIEKALAVLEQENAIAVFSLNHARAVDIQKRLEALLCPSDNRVGSVIVDEKTNQVIVTTLPKRMKNVERLIAAFDREPVACEIEIRIVVSEKGKEDKIRNYSINTVSGQENKIHYGTRVPYVMAESTEFVDVGILISLTVSFADGGIYMQSMIELNEMMSAREDNIPIIRASSAEITSIHKSSDFQKLFSGSFLESERSVNVYIKAVRSEGAKR